MLSVFITIGLKNKALWKKKKHELVNLSWKPSPFCINECLVVTMAFVLETLPKV